MTTARHIGIDMGGSKLQAGAVESGVILGYEKVSWDGHSLSVNEVLDILFRMIDPMVTKGTQSIGIGVPGTVDMESGTVYDLENIPDWKEVGLGKILEDRYGIRAVVNNDSNCFALGESLQPYAAHTSSLAAVTIGTGLGVGIVIDKRLYTGRNCGAGEFGAMPYLDKTVEYYASGHFFKLQKTTGELVSKQAKQGDPTALQLMNEFGIHMGAAIRFLLFALDPELIILGGSVSRAFPYFKSSMMESLQSFPFTNVRKNLTIKVSEAEGSTLLGAANLWKSTSESLKEV